MNGDHSGTPHHQQSQLTTHPSSGWAFIKLLLDTYQWVQTINYDAWG